MYANNWSIGRRALWGGCVLLAAAVMSGSASRAAATGFLTSQHEKNGTVYVRVMVPAAGGPGWQSSYQYNAPAGKNFMFDYVCPTDAPTPVNGSFNTNAAARPGLALVGNYRPSTQQNAWAWVFDWPKGAPSGSVFYFNVYCAQ